MISPLGALVIYDPNSMVFNALSKSVEILLLIFVDDLYGSVVHMRSTGLVNLLRGMSPLVDYFVTHSYDFAGHHMKLQKLLNPGQCLYVFY